MEATTAPRQEWTFAQWALVVVITLQLLWALAGLIAEPSFDFGDDAATRKVLGVDFNGVHALSGFLLFGPAFFFALKPRWAELYAIYVAVALIVTGLWAIWSTSPAGVFTFPNNGADAILHLTTGFLFAGVALVQYVLDHRISPGSGSREIQL